MKANIKATIVLPSRLVKKADWPQDGMEVKWVENLEGLSQIGYQDVILVGDEFLQSWDRSKWSNSAVVVICEKENKLKEIYPKAVAINVHTIVNWPLNSSDLRQTIIGAYNTLLAGKKNQASRDGEGKVISVTSFSNGSGKSVIAYNLALQLGKYFPEGGVCLVDLNSPLGRGKVMLNTESAYGWDTIRPLLREGNVKDSKLISVLSINPYHFSYLAGPQTFSAQGKMNVKEFENLVVACRRIFKITVFDTFTITEESEMMNFQQADLMMVVVAMDSGSVFNTFRGMEAVREKMGTQEKVVMVANRVDEKKGRGTKALKERLGEVFGEVVEDSDAIREYTDQGKLFTDKNLLVTAQLSRLAEKVLHRLF